MRRPATLLGASLLLAACGTGAPAAPTPAAPTTSTSSVLPTTPAATSPAATPGATAPAATSPAATSPPPTEAPTGSPSADAYERLLAHVPPGLRDSCEDDPDDPAERQLAGAMCDLPRDHPGADLVTYELFQTPEAMDAYQDLLLRGWTNLGGVVTGPGCGQGPGAGTWEHGRMICYTVITDDANVDWTHTGLAIRAHAFLDDPDWAALDAFVKTAGPIE